MTEVGLDRRFGSQKTIDDPTSPERMRAAVRAVGKMARFALEAAGVTLAAGVLVAGNEYVADINDVRTALADTHPYVIESSPPLDHEPVVLPVPEGALKTLSPADITDLRDSVEPPTFVTINMPGFGMVETYRPNAALSPFDSLGAQWSIHYDNSGIDVDVLADTIAAKIKADSVDEVGFYLDSMGTIIGCETAALLHEKLPDLKIKFLALDSPAVGEDVLSDKSRADGYTLLDGINFPGAEYSRYARQAAELYLRADEVHDLPSLLNVNGTVHADVFNNEDFAGNTLLAEQFQMIVSADVGANLKTLADVTASGKPVIIFMGAQDPARDDVVNMPKSYADIRKWTHDSGLTLLGPYGIKDFYHGAQWRSAAEYRRLLAQRILPDLARQTDVQNPDDMPGELFARADG